MRLLSGQTKVVVPLVIGFVLSIVTLFAISASKQQQIVHQEAAGTALAFPGADGWGKNTIGGRGGRVIYVTNLNDTGPGSLRDAVEATGNRTVLFKVGGTIVLKSDISLTNPFITIAGQTAPGEGIQIRDGMIKITTHDVIIRYLKIRPGDVPTASDQIGAADWARDAITLNALNGNQASNIIIDHCSLVWGPDIGSVSMLGNVQDVTLSNSILGEGLFLSNHPEGISPSGHAYGASVFQLAGNTTWGHRITHHHNLLTSSEARNPAVSGVENFDFVNNVVYNFGNKAGHGSPRSMNFMNNMYIKGPLTNVNVMWTPQDLHITVPQNSVYESGNIANGMTLRGACSGCYASSQLQPFSLSTIDSAQVAYEKIISNAGANRPIRDSVDQRIIANVVNEQGNFYWNGTCAHCTTNKISWPTLASVTPATDSDNDGMADNWEQTNFGSLSRGSSSNSAGDFDSDGYTDLEEYLNETGPTGSAGSPSPTSIPSGTRLGITLLLHGIGKGGDNVAPGGTGNMNPQRLNRTVTVDVFNSNNQLAMTKQGTVTFNAAAGNFQGTVDVASLPTGIYQVRLKVPQYLGKIIPGIISITAGQTMQLPTVSLVTGDSDSNNQVNILDYNLLLDCFSELAAPRNCTAQNKKLMTDLTDDGKVNQFDYNLLLREFSVQSAEVI